MRKAQQGGIFFRLLALLVLAMLVAAVYLVRYPLLRLAGNALVVEDRPERADAIVILGDDNFGGERAGKAAELYREGMAPLVVASGRQLRSYAGIAELMARDLETRGVPKSAIVPFPQRAGNTREEAQALRDLVAQHGWKRILLVTSNYHTRRARYIFRKVFAPQITILTIAVRDSDYDPDRWWEMRQGKKLFFLETVGSAVAILELWDDGATTGAASSSSVPSPAPTAR